MSSELKSKKKIYPHSKPIDKLNLKDAINLMIKDEQKKSITVFKIIKN